MLKRRVSLLLVMLMLLSVMAPAVYAQDKPGKADSGIQLKVSNQLVSMTEAREIEVQADFGTKADLSQLKWTFGGKDLSEWKQWNKDAKKYTGAPYITFASKPAYINGTTKIKAKIRFDLLYGTVDLSPRSIRVLYPELIGTYDLAVEDTGSHQIAKSPLKLNVYDNYLKYDELKPEINKIFKDAKKDRYLSYESIGKSVENRDVHFVVLAKDNKSVDKYLNEIAPQKVENPAELQKKLANGTLGDYKIPVWFNNIHPDEAQGVDAIVELLKDFATQDQVSYMTTDEQGKEQKVTINTKDALDKVILLFNFTENPDGRYHNTRQNANGFDLNRDNAYQTQPETRILAREMAKWMPISMIDFHGYYKEFVIEPCTPPHNPNYEYDLLMDGMVKQAHAMGNAGIANTKYDSYLVPLEGWPDKFDDATPSYTSTFSMFFGAMGHTVEVPELNEESFKAQVDVGLGAVKFVMDGKDKLFNNQLEMYKRGVLGEDNKAVDKWLINAKGEQIGRPRGNNQNFFPDYYVLPVDKKLQKNPLEAYNMVEYLQRNGVKVEQTTESVKVGDKTYPAGTYVVPMLQAMRGYANTVLYDGADVSDWNELYAEILMNFHDLRGFNRDEVRVKGAFDGKTEKVKDVKIPGTTVQGNAAAYVIKNTNNDAIKAVNKLLAEGKTVKLIESLGPEYEIGDYLVAKKDLESIKNDFYLDVAAFDNGAKTKGLTRPKVANVGSASTKFVLEQLGFDVVKDVKDATVIVDDAGNVAKEEIAKGKSYIGIGTSALEGVKKGNILPGFDYSQTAGSRADHEGLLRAKVVQNSEMTGGYDNDELLYVATGSWITRVPEQATVLARVSDKDNYFVAGWWPGKEGLKGQVLALTEKVGDANVTLFANDITHKAHSQNSYRFLANTIFASTK
ncbi:M14 family metallopeptidase [Aneurinibacillus tyrosinisolvens]|uniref:M14 family metallopeptidase n=1 Tax=Aneurinibacillus tyrosinisolvens TaxID=1443435 RepID=UPI00063F9FA5|nr:M14 family zinc carboxypeptidase [Aneurinibacillus tyrosinisolvens]